MSVIARFGFVGVSALAVVACASPEPSSSTAAASSAVEASAPSCSQIDVRFERAALFHDLQKSLAPEHSSGEKVSVAGSIVSEADGDAFTHLTTVMDGHVSFYEGDDGSPRRSLLTISGGFPDPLHGDRAAHRLYDAMTRAVEVDEWRRVSKDGLFECHVDGWKGGDLYVCTFPDPIDVGGHERPSAVCAD